VRNIGVGGPGIYSQEDGSQWGIRTTVSSPELLDWYIGEIHILKSDVKPNTPRSELELDADSRRAIGLIRDFYEERIMYRRANSDVNSHVSQVGATAKEIGDGTPYDPVGAARLLKQMGKYESLSKPRKAALTGIEGEKRKILKQREAKDADIAKHRREIINHLEQIVGSSTAKRGRKAPTKSAKSLGNGNGDNNSGRTATQGTIPIADYEQLLSDILLALERERSIPSRCSYLLHQ
jgi:hypothetical protein